MAYCAECGTKLEDGARFCANCGHAVMIEAEPAAEVTPVEAAGKNEPPSTESVIQVVEELVGTVMREIDAPSAIGESTLCTWKNAEAGSVPSAVASAAAQVVGTAAQKAAGVGAGQARQGFTGETAQFMAHQKSERSSPQGRGETSPAKKSKLPIIMIVVGVVVLVAIFALYVVPRFISHPYDPNSHIALTSDSSASASASASASSETASSGSASNTSSTAASASASSASAEASSASAEISSSTTSASSGASPSSSEAASSTATPTGYSTDERPKIGDFKWLDGEAMKGNAPADAQRIVDLGALTGGWKGYIVGSNKEWLVNANIEVGQAGVTMAIDWYYMRSGGSGDGQEDTTPTSTFTGTFDGGMLDATGSGRITIAAFWEKDGHQYGVGSYMWPSGESSTIALVRP